MVVSVVTTDVRRRILCLPVRGGEEERRKVRIDVTRFSLLDLTVMRSGTRGEG